MSHRRTLELSVCCPFDGSPPPVVDHLRSTLVAGVRLVDRASGPDLWWLGADDTGVEVLAAAEQGAVVIGHSPGALGLNDVTSAQAPDDLRPLQELYSRLREVLAPHLALVFGAELSQQPLVVPRGRGILLLLGSFPLADGSGFRVDAHLPIRSAVSQLIVDEVLAWAFRRKHGVAVRKLMGPYGAPMLAWQAHFEDLGGFWNRSLESFVGLLANSRQAPTYSLIRNLYHWGRRTPGLVAFRSDGLRAQPDGPAFFSGVWVRRVDGGDLGFESDPRFVEYFQPTPGQGRVYPAPLPDGRIALGTPGGQVALFAVRAIDDRLALEPLGALRLADGSELAVSGGAAPSVSPRGDLLVVGDDAGSLHCFEPGDGGWVRARCHQLAQRGSPRLVDWSGTGSVDLLLGNEDGSVEVAPDFKHQGLARRALLFQSSAPRVAPFATGPQCVIFGDAQGRLWRWARGELALLPSEDPSVLGTCSPYVQQDAVPVALTVAGREWLIVGASVVGAPVPLITPPIAEAFRTGRRRLAPSGTSFSAHVALAPDLPLADVAAELERHRAAFGRVGLPWVGADQHCWWVPKKDVESVFLLQRTSGLLFNFGWQPPCTSASPDGDAEFCLSFPFLLRHEGHEVDFVLHNPVNPARWPEAQAFMTERGLPAVLFVHPEHRVAGEGAAELDRWLGAIEDRRRRRGAVFVSTHQMAQAIAVTLTSRVALSLGAGVLEIEADRSGVPAWAAAWANTLAVTVEGAGLETDAEAAFPRDGRLVLTVGAGAKVGEGLSRPRAWSLRGANGPVRVTREGVEVESPGFQELLLSGAELRVDWDGAHRRELPGGVTSFTRFGPPGLARVRRAPLRRPAEIAWSTNPSQQDQWVVNEVFQGRPPARGFFIETGAADGVTRSSTLALERTFGWDGIAVEPNTTFFERLRQNRRCAVENACITEKSGVAEFIEASWYGRIREHVLDELPGGDHLANPYFQRDFDGSAARVVRKPALSLESLLLVHRAPRRIDFMSIDAEFSEWWILRGFPFDRWEVACLCMRSKFFYEGTLFDGKYAAELRRHLGNFGYFYDRERSRHVEHDFFVHPGLVSSPFADALTWRPPSLVNQVVERVSRRLRRSRSAR